MVSPAHRLFWLDRIQPLATNLRERDAGAIAVRGDSLRVNHPARSAGARSAGARRVLLGPRIRVHFDFFLWCDGVRKLDAESARLKSHNAECPPTARGR